MKTKAELAQKKIKGSWSCNSKNMVKSFRSAKTKWGINLSAEGQQDIFLAFNRKSDAVDSLPFFAKWEGQYVDFEQFIFSLGYSPSGYKGLEETAAHSLLP